MKRGYNPYRDPNTGRFISGEEKSVNTSWLDEDERKKYAQIEANKQQASDLNGKSDLQSFGGRSSEGVRNSTTVSEQEQFEAIHNYQQVSWEGLSIKEKRTLSHYIDTQADVEDKVSRGMTVSQSTIDNWLKQGSISFDGMTSWSTDGSISARFSEVSRSVDAEEGKRSVIIVSEKGLTNSAALPRTNSYAESEVLTSTKDYEIVSSRVQQSVGANKSPTTTIIFVRPRRKR